MPKQKDPNREEQRSGSLARPRVIWCRRAVGAAGSMEPASPTIIRLRWESKTASRNADGFAFVPHRAVFSDGRGWVVEPTVEERFFGTCRRCDGAGLRERNFLDAHLCAIANCAALNQAAHNKGIPWLAIRDIPCSRFPLGEGKRENLQAPSQLLILRRGAGGARRSHRAQLIELTPRPRLARARDHCN